MLVHAMEKDGIKLGEYPIMQFISDFSKSGFTGGNASGEYGTLTCNPGKLMTTDDGCELMIDFRIPATADSPAIIRKVEAMASGYGLRTEVSLEQWCKDKAYCIILLSSIRKDFLLLKIDIQLFADTSSTPVDNILTSCYAASSDSSSGSMYCSSDFFIVSGYIFRKSFFMDMGT